MRSLVLAVLLGLAALTPASQAAAPRDPLGHVGRWITDADGRVAILQGVAIVPPSESVTPESAGISEDDARFLAANGWNLVRLGLFYRGYEVRPGAFDNRYLASYERTQRLLARHGIFSVIDFHQDMLSPKYQGRGFPDWFVDDDGVPNEPKVGFPGNYFVNSAVNRAFDNLWANSGGVQDHFAEGWRRVASRFAAAPYVGGYDIFNEPWPGSTWQACASTEGCPPGGFDQTQLTAFSNKVIAGIRRGDRRHLAFYEPNLQFDVGAATRHGKTRDRNVGMSFHDYCLGAAPGLPHAPDPTGVCREQGEKRVLTNADAHSKSTGAALLLTEFGDTGDAAIHKRVADLADEFGIGWTTWAYFGSSANLIRDPKRPPAGANLRQSIVGGLVRPHPQAVAGTPKGYGFDGRRFHLTYSTARLGGGAFRFRADTRLFVPRLQYPRGYDVRVTGGQAISPPGAARLHIRACTGRAQVRVSVTPGSGAQSADCRAPRTPPSRIKLRVRPRRAHVGRLTTFRFRATIRRGRPLRGARIQFAGRHLRTNRRGRARVRMRLRGTGRYCARAFRTGLRPGQVTVRARE